MNRLTACLKTLRKQNKTALITYIMAGYPDLETSRRLIPALAEAGADIVEVGIPFSDPLADGPVIQNAGEVALKKGMTTDGALDMIRRVRADIAVPLVLMTYYNIVLQQGLSVFARKAAAAGADGVIIPDLPPEEGVEWQREAAKAELATVFLIAPTSSDRRIKAAARVSTGFVYCVSLLGVTGSGKGPVDDLAGFLVRARRCTEKPLAVGFGIATPDQARDAGRSADGVIVGSAILDKISGKNGDLDVESVVAFVKELKAAL